MSPHLSQLNVAMAHRNYFRRNNMGILKLATYTKIEDQYFRCKLATLDWKWLPNVHILFCLHKTSKFYWFIMKIKKFMLPIWWCNRGWFPLGNKYLGSSFEWVERCAYHVLEGSNIRLLQHISITTLGVIHLWRGTLGCNIMRMVTFEGANIMECSYRGVWNHIEGRL